MAVAQCFLEIACCGLYDGLQLGLLLIGLDNVAQHYVSYVQRQPIPERVLLLQGGR